MSLVVWLPLNGDLHNQGLNNTNITNTNATLNNNGKIGKCYNFNGSNSYIKGNTFLNNNSTAFSFSCWINFNSISRTQCLFSNRTEVSEGGFSIFYKTGDGFYFDSGSRWGFTSPVSISANKWYHFCFTWEKNKNENKKYYCNGELKNTTTSNSIPSAANTTYFSIGGSQSNINGNGTDNFLNAKINDVRIYDHCLSPKEVEEISKGLVLHYQLNNYWLAGNLLVNTHFDNRLSQTTGWDTSKNGTLVANRWGGYNSGIANQATVYHAHLKEVNGEYVYEFIKDENNSWLGISQSGVQSKLTAGIKYTFSWEQYCVSGSNFARVGLYYYKTGASSRGFHIGYGYGNSGRVIGKWQKFTYTFTAPSDADYAKDMIWYIYGNDGGNGTFYARHFKLEKGDKATFWCPAKSDNLYTTLGYNSTTIYDSSGYSNNGTIIGSLSATAPSPRYNCCIEHLDSCADYIYRPYLSFLDNSGFTFSCWINPSSYSRTNNGTTAIGNQFILSQGRDCITSGTDHTYGASLIIYNGKPQFLCGNGSLYSNTTIPIGEWAHVVGVWTGTQKKIYINGVLKNSANDNKIDWSEAQDSLVIGKMAFGKSSSTAYFPFIGKISDVRIYATALTDSQIKELYNTSMQIDSSGNVFARELVEL